jgi:hypothetical protein
MREGKPSDPIGMLREIEAYLTFRLLSDTPSVPHADMYVMKSDIADCLRINGVEVDFKPNANLTGNQKPEKGVES